MAKATLEVIDERVKNLILDNSQEHQMILAQTTKTNGKVADISKIQERTIGAMIVLNMFVVPVILAVIIDFIRKNIGG